MEHCAIDLGGKESQICVRGSDAQIVEERRCRTAELPGYLSSRPKSRVVSETCSEAFRIGARTKLLNTVRGWLRAEGRRPRGGEVTTFSAPVRAVCANTTLPIYVERQLRMGDD